MKFLGTLVLSLWVVSFLHAQQGGATPPQEAEASVDAFALNPTPGSAAFFSGRELDEGIRRAEDRAGRSQDGTYRSVSRPGGDGRSETALSTFTGFFTDMFSSIRLGRHKTAKAEPSSLIIEPSEFSLGDRREVEATYEVRNLSKKIMRLDYPTGQQIEILATDEGGRVVERWSDDRAFEKEESIVFINPRERIQYSEKIPTREMKAGSSYTISAQSVDHPEFNASRPVTPEP